jgi:hypothetical protein
VFEVLAELPVDAKQGMFAVTKKYPALVRYSNGASARRADNDVDIRGIAVELIGVHGDEILSGMESVMTRAITLGETEAGRARTIGAMREASARSKTSRPTSVVLGRAQRFSMKPGLVATMFAFNAVANPSQPRYGTTSPAAGLSTREATTE